MYRLFHWNETLGLSFDTIGKVQAWPSLLIILFGYSLGSVIDKFKPVRLVPMTFAVWSLINVYAFFFLKKPARFLSL